MNIQKPDELNLGNNRIEIYDKDNNLLKVIEPYAVESCMNPGIFKITPIKIEKTKDSIIFISENIKTEIKKQDIESGDIEVKASDLHRKGEKQRVTAPNVLTVADAAGKNEFLATD